MYSKNRFELISSLILETLDQKQKQYNYEHPNNNQIEEETTSNVENGKNISRLYLISYNNEWL